jgi:molybdopterin synthase catalytic subunit
VRSELNGSVITFLGTTRLFNEGRKVLYLEYETYPEMAVKELEKVRQEIRERWGISDVAIGHRLGRLEIEDISMIVAVASPHRKEGFQAAAYVVDRVKESVPIWKKEYFEGGSHWVACDDHEMHEQHETPATPARAG